MKKIIYRYAENNDRDVNHLFDLSKDLEKFNQKYSTRPAEHFTGDWQEYFREEIIESLNNEKSWVFLALENDAPVGFVYSRLCEGCYKYIIDELYVKAAYRKLGIGTKLLDSTLDIGKKYEYPIIVEVFDWNKDAIEFYKAHNFGIDSIMLKLRDTA
jgi:ribosomal protein S18 acetylase RimI-like enzyme